jgi:hypothetical protein
LEVEWRDGTTSWLPLKTLKNTNSVQVAEYTHGNKIDIEPAFDWWVPTVFRRHNRIIKGAQSRHQRTGFKFGIRLPTSIKNAKEIDHENGNTLWRDTLRKEMFAVMVAFEVQLEEIKFVPGYKCIPGHIVWDVKMDFTRKARYVAGGHWTDPPKVLTYSSVVSHESVRIAMLVAGLNDLDIQMADIGKAYLNAPTTKKCYVIAGDELGPELKGQTLKIVRACMALSLPEPPFEPTSPLSFVCSYNFGPVKPILMSGCVELRKPMEPLIMNISSSMSTTWMFISGDPHVVIQLLKEHFLHNIVSDPAATPKRYLGAMIGRYQFADGSQAWYMSADYYLSKAILTVM